MHLRNTVNVGRARWLCGRKLIFAWILTCVKRVCQALIMLSMWVWFFFPVMKTGHAELDLWITVDISYGYNFWEGFENQKEMEVTWLESSYREVLAHRSLDQALFCSNFLMSSCVKARLKDTKVFKYPRNICSRSGTSKSGALPLYSVLEVGSSELKSVFPSPLWKETISCFCCRSIFV